jgi:glycosyltransferase involved in cell wall biosynthesis
MKVVYVVEALELSGGVKVIVEHAEGLAARGHDVSLLTRDPRHDWIPIHVPILGVPRFEAATLPEADVHIATWFPTVVPTVRARRAPKIFHFSQGYEALYPNVAHRLEEIEEAYRQPVPKLLISAHLLPLFEGRFPGPFHVLPQAIRAGDYRPSGPEPEGPKVPPVVGVVGPFEAANKGIRFALAAVRRLREEGRRLQLHRASQLPLSDEERGLLSADVYSHALSVAGMAGFYRGLDVLLHPSYDAEGFPLPPLEAMASGVPVVLTDIPSYAPIARDAAGFVPQGDFAAMAGEAARLLDDAALWRARRRRGLEAASTFTLAPVLDRLESLFREGQKIS